MANEKVMTSFYLSQDVRQLVKFLHKREDLTKTAFYKKALRFFFEEDSEIEAHVLITEKNNPDYVKRNVLETIHLEPEHKQLVEKLAKEKGCSEGQIIFSALVNYCAALLKVDSTGVTIEE